MNGTAPDPGRSEGPRPRPSVAGGPHGRAGRWARIGALVTVAWALTLAWPVVPAGGELPGQLIVLASDAVASPLGIVTRIPATSRGGVDYTRTALTLDKATALAAGFTLGDLAEAFLVASDRPLDGSPVGSLQPQDVGYRNPTLVRAQYPPSPESGAPASSETPGGNVQAQASDAPRAEAHAAGGSAAVAGVVEVAPGSATSTSELLGNGTVVTTATATATGVVVGEVVTIAAARSRAVTTVPAGGAPTHELDVTLSGVSVNGVPAELTPEGLRVGDQVPLPASQLAAFDAGLRALAERGLFLKAFPRLAQSADATSARAGGAALSIRYDLTDTGLPPSGFGEFPYHEELLVAEAEAFAQGRRRLPGPPPGLIPDATLAPVPGESGAGTAPRLGEAPGPEAAPAPPPPGAEIPAATVEVGEALPAAPAAGRPLEAPEASTRRQLQPAGQEPPPLLAGSAAVDAIRRAYRSFLLVAFLGAALAVLRQRTPLT